MGSVHVVYTGAVPGSVKTLVVVARNDCEAPLPREGSFLGRRPPRMACALETRASQGPSGMETPSADPSTGAVLTLAFGGPYKLSAYLSVT